MALTLLSTATTESAQQLNYNGLLQRNPPIPALVSTRKASAAPDLNGISLWQDLS
jgi:hypothetical protein